MPLSVFRADRRRQAVRPLHLVSVALLFASGLVLAASRAGGPPPLVPGSGPAPDFALETMTGETFRLSEQRGRVVVLNFWATWCPPCRREMPDFIALQEELGHRGLVFAGVALDEGGWEAVRPFAEALGVNYPLMVDDGRAAAAYGPIRAMPTTFLIDHEGEVRHYAPGMLTQDVLRPVLLEMLAARDVAG